MSKTKVDCTIYVDELHRVWSRHQGWRYPYAAHLWCADAATLEWFARRLQLNKSWRHGDHYDLTAGKRAAAIRLGATAVTTRELCSLRQKHGSPNQNKKFLQQTDP
ncbi:MAG: DUF4031 domain-containing protein [Planctomycetota bacterium]